MGSRSRSSGLLMSPGSPLLNSPDSLPLGNLPPGSLLLGGVGRSL
jgi:hypothetical protein